MAHLLFGEQDLYAGNTEDFPWTAELYESDSVTRAALAANDVVYCVLSERDKAEPADAALEIDSDNPTANDSLVVIEDLGDAVAPRDASGYVRFAEADTAAIVAAWADTVRSRRYVCEMFYLDASETDPALARKLLLRGVMHLHRSAVLS